MHQVKTENLDILKDVFKWIMISFNKMLFTNDSDNIFYIPISPIIAFFSFSFYSLSVLISILPPPPPPPNLSNLSCLMLETTIKRGLIF